MSFSTTVAGLVLEHPIMNAAGTCKRWEGAEGVETLVRSATAAVMLGSITYEARNGNDGEVYFPDPRGRFALNSLGLPNPGSQYLITDLATISRAVQQQGKPLFVSVAGFSPAEFAELTSIAIIGGADLVELNLGCPNVWQEGEQKPIPSYHPGLLRQILEEVEGRLRPFGIPLAVKLSPLEPGLLRQVATILTDFPSVQVVTTCNTFPNGFAYNGEQQAIANLDGFAGVSGAALKPIGLGQVRQFRALLPRRVDIIGVGGISTGQDVVDYLRAGAKAAQIGTALIDRGPRVFSELLAEYTEIVS